MRVVYGILRVASAKRSTRLPISIHELEAEMLGLSPADRAHLLERLIDSFEPDTKVQDAWVVEALRRESEVASGKVALVSGEDAVARIRARIA